MPRIASLALCAFLIACGAEESKQQDPDIDLPDSLVNSVKVGASCTPENGWACSSSSEGLVCESAIFRAIPCRGPAGCLSDDTRTVCDTTRALAGDACPKSQEQLVQCDAANADKALKCVNSVWQSQACKSCAVSSGNVYCVP